MEVIENSKELAQPGQYLTFELRNQSYALPIQSVIEINQMTDITPIPEAPTFVMGVINLRGKIIPVIDLGIRFSMDKQEYTKETCIIVIEIDKAFIGIVVDSVNEVLTLSEQHIEESPKVGHQGSNMYINGMGMLDEKVVIMLDITEIFKSLDLSKLTTSEQAS